MTHYHDEEVKATDRAFFGHPKALGVIFGTEFWERFSYYGMRAILLLYLTTAIADGGLGLEQAHGEAVVAIYGASVFLFSIAGGWIADRLLGTSRTLLLGSFIIIAGHTALALPWAPASWAGIVLVAVGSGVFKPNPSALVGALYTPDDRRRSAGFSIFYMAVNFGSLVSPWVVSFLRNAWGFHAGFSAAAIGMLMAIVAFIWGRGLLRHAGEQPSNPMADAAERADAWRKVGFVVLGVFVLYLVVALVQGNWVMSVIDTMSLICLITPLALFVAMFRSKEVSQVERLRLRAFVPLFIAAMLFFMIFEQAASKLTSFAAHRTQLDWLGIHLNPEWFQSINPFLIVTLTPLFAWLWTRTDGIIRVGHKFTVGLALAGVSFLVMMWASISATDNQATPLWLVVVYAIQTIGELCLSPVGLAATSLLAPKAFQGQAMALWLLANAAGQSITAQTIRAMEGTSDTVYYGLLGGIALVFALILGALTPWIHKHANDAASTNKPAKAA
ncbi:peptide MFS transporter [uncultured Tessaracoccus sp.]|uniref:peptide MFS transporter n=1 Tax=uncultured Tessaracoccus sp. TaxID=905023 RepID=UPI0025E32255|nr:oligopeptide:H+ symporter [uncultured Tessaracoccus sp.]